MLRTPTVSAGPPRLIPRRRTVSRRVAVMRVAVGVVRGGPAPLGRGTPVSEARGRLHPPENRKAECECPHASNTPSDVVAGPWRLPNGSVRGSGRLRPHTKPPCLEPLAALHAFQPSCRCASSGAETGSGYEPPQPAARPDPIARGRADSHPGGPYLAFAASSCALAISSYCAAVCSWRLTSFSQCTFCCAMAGPLSEPP